MPRSEIGAIILAAGEGTRFRQALGHDAPASKLVALYEGKPLVRHVADAALSAGLAGVMVVTGHAQASVRTALDDLTLTFVHNPDYASGMASSLKTGFAVWPAGWSAALVLLGDMPLIDAGLITQIADAFDGKGSAVVPLFQGERGNPVLLSVRLVPEIAHLAGDAGARHLLRGRSDVIELPVAQAAARIDIDTPEALSRLASSSDPH